MLAKHTQRMAWMAALTVAGLTACGCSGSGAHPIAQMINDFSPPTPTEAVNDAFNLYDPDARRRAVALLSAAPFGGEDVYVRIYRIHAGSTGEPDPDPTVRAVAVKALGIHGAVEDVAVLSRRLGDDSATVRWEAAKALQKIHGQAAVRPLLVTLRSDEDNDVRMAAAAALGQYATMEVYDGLVAALTDANYGVKHAASRSLTTLTGQYHGLDTRKWIDFAHGRDDVFADRQQYVWMPYDAPPTLLDRLQVWEEKEPVQGRVPTGLQSSVDQASGPSS